jgi:hypothetical protein
MLARESILSRRFRMVFPNQQDFVPLSKVPATFEIELTDSLRPTRCLAAIPRAFDYFSHFYEKVQILYENATRKRNGVLLH